MYLLDNKETLYDLEHASVLPGIGVLLRTRFGEVCSSDRTVGSVRQDCSRYQTFCNRATW